jgi:hypothetical protein
MATRLTLGQPKAKCPGALEHGAHERALSVYADGLLWRQAGRRHGVDKQDIHPDHSGTMPGNMSRTDTHRGGSAPARAKKQRRRRRSPMNSLLRWSAGFFTGVGSKGGLKHS